MKSAVARDVEIGIYGPVSKHPVPRLHQQPALLGVDEVQLEVYFRVGLNVEGNGLGSLPGLTTIGGPEGNGGTGRWRAHGLGRPGVRRVQEEVVVAGRARRAVW